jgi:hypothetical protein
VNALEESAHAILLSYIALTGLITGHLFQISLKPWRLRGFSHWIENHRNEFTVPEYGIYFLCLEFQTKTAFSFSAITASFWTGYNLEELTTLLTAKLFSQKQPRDGTTPRETWPIIQTVLPHWSTVIFISLNEAILTGLSLLIT